MRKPDARQQSGGRPKPNTTKPNQKNHEQGKILTQGFAGRRVIQTCTNLKTSLTGNANFPTPTPTLIAFGGVLTNAQTKLTAADTAQAAAKQATMDKDTAMGALQAMAMQLAGYVDLTANGNETMILKRGPERARRQDAAVRAKPSRQPLADGGRQRGFAGRALGSELQREKLRGAVERLTRSRPRASSRRTR